MERLLYNLILGVAEYANVTVIGPKNCHKHFPKTIRVYESSRKLTGFLAGSIFKALGIVRKGTFDVVIGGSGLIAPLLWLLKLLFRCKTMVLVHGLDIVASNSLYQYIFVPTLRRVDKVVANSRNTRRLAIEKGVHPDRITIIHPGTNIPEPPDEIRKREFLTRYQIPYKQYMIFAGRITRRKGLAPFIQNSLPAILDACPDSGLVVVGDNPDDSLNQQGDKLRALTAAAEKGLQKKIMFLGQINDRDLETAFSGAAVHVFPLIDEPGDVEGFGMVVIEAAAMGTSTVAFDIGGAADAATLSGGELVKSGDYDQLSQFITSKIKEDPKKDDLAASEKNLIGWNRFHQEIRETIMQKETQKSNILSNSEK